MSAQTTPAGVTLETLKAALLQAGVQAETLHAKEQIGSTADLLDEIRREIQHCCEALDDEMRQLKKWGISA